MILSNSITIEAIPFRTKTNDKRLSTTFFNSKCMEEIQAKFNIHKFKISFLDGNRIKIQYPLNNPYFYVELVKSIQLIQLTRKTSYFANSPYETRLFLKLLRKNIREEIVDFETKKSMYTKSYLETQFKLYPHQAVSVMELDSKLTYLTKHSLNNTGTNASSGLILNQPRTGKTRTSLVYGLLKDFEHYLIVSPKSAIMDWKKEIEEIMNTPAMRDKEYEIKIIEGASDIKDTYSADIIYFYITNYERLRTLSTTEFRRLIRYTETNLKRCFLVDEAHRLRNYDSLQSQAVFAVKYQLQKTLSKSKGNQLLMLALTGTPAIKHTMDAFGLLAFTNLGGMWLTPNERSFNIFKNYFYEFKITPFGKEPTNLKRANEMQHIIKSFAVQYRTDELDFFKGYTEKKIKVMLKCEPFQKKIYDIFAENFEFGEVDASNPMVKELRLRQIATNPAILFGTYKKIPPKYKWILEQCKNNIIIPTIYFSKSVRVLDALSKLLSENDVNHEYINGKSSIVHRSEAIDNFQNEKVDFILLQIDVGKENLTLSRAKRTVFIDRDFTVGVNDQASARQFPTVPETVTKEIIDLVMLDTNEMSLYDRLVRQRKDIKTVNDIKGT